MKLTNTLLKLAAAAAAVAGIAYLVYKHIDTITDWLQKLCPCKYGPVVKKVSEVPFEEPVAEEFDFDDVCEEAPAADAPVEEAPAEEPAPEIPDGEPVAEEDDFAE